MEKQCIFCKIAAGEIPARKIYDSEDFTAFLDARPANPGHVLVIPNEHYPTLPDLPENLNPALLQLVKIIAQAQIEALGAQGVNVLQNNGEAAGQAVPHVHIHIIPRFKDDKVVLNWAPVEIKPEQTNEVQKRLMEKARELAIKEIGETPKVKESIEPEQKGKKKLHKVRPRTP